MIKQTTIGIDAGSSQSGVIILDEKNIRRGCNIENDEVFDLVVNNRELCEQLIVVIEDVRPYKAQISEHIIQTIKFLGQIEWRLKASGIPFTLIPRWHVKQWVFLQYRAMAETEISKNMVRHYALKDKKGLGVPLNKQRTTPTFVYVDDRIVQKAMRLHWRIEKPKVGSTTPFGLKDHSWQALGLISYFMASR